MSDPDPSQDPGAHAPSDDPYSFLREPRRDLRSVVERCRELLERRPLIAAAIGVAGALAVLVVWNARGPSAPVEASLPRVDDVVANLTPTTTTTAAFTVVHAAGAVAVPGVYEVAEPARVVDVLDAAGGLAPDADPDRVNLAARVRDGERVYVPREGEEPPPVVVGVEVSPAGSESRPLQLNTATAEQLEALPGVGPATAAAILALRDERGDFGAVEELLDVAGIGPAKLEQIRPHVSV